MHNVQVGSFLIGKGQKLALISGPCVIEDEAHTLECARRLKEVCTGKPINLIFKASYDKANRSSHRSFRGPGIQEGLKILQKVKDEFNLPVIADIHSPEEAEEAAQVLDILQIPAFLCRQTDLINAAAKTGKPLHIKKGQFMAPWDMKNVVEKAYESGNKQIFLADRGTTFGYNNLVSDMRALAIMQKLGCPVCYDASHSVQLPGAGDGVSGGDREFIPLLARAAVAVGIQALFIETHTSPKLAKSDAASVFPLNELSNLLDDILAIHAIVTPGLRS